MRPTQRGEAGLWSADAESASRTRRHDGCALTNHSKQKKETNTMKRHISITTAVSTLVFTAFTGSLQALPSSIDGTISFSGTVGIRYHQPGDRHQVHILPASRGWGSQFTLWRLCRHVGGDGHGNAFYLGPAGRQHPR